MPLAIATYPGITQIRSANFTFSAHGTVPSACVVQIYPQKDLPAAVGTLLFSYGGIEVPFPLCKVNTASFTRNDQGQIWSFQIIDRRWRWAEHTISGAYNLRKDDESLDTATEMTPQELAKLLFGKLGETGADVTALPNETRPLVQWDYANVAHELDSLCDSLGCRVVTGLDNQVRICKLGAGAELPDLPIIADDSGSVDPPEVPDFLRVVFGPTRVQAIFAMEAVGLDTNGRIKPINSLSYKPAAGWGQIDLGEFRGLSSVDPTGPGGADNSPRALAKRTVFRWYRVLGMLDSKFDRKIRPKLSAEFNFTFNDFTQFLPLLPDLLDVDSATGKANEPFVQGTFAKLDGLWNNSTTWERYKQPFSINADKGIVDFSNYTFKWATAGTSSNLTEATLYLNAAFSVKHHKTREIHHVYRQLSLGGNNGTGAKVLKSEDVSGTLRANYDSSGRITTFTDNSRALNDEADFMLKAAAAEFQLKATHDRTYRGIVPIQPDGAIQQITFACVQGQGPTTRASRNNEYHLSVPSYKERQRIGRQRARVVEQQAAALRRQARMGGAWHYV